MAVVFSEHYFYLIAYIDKKEHAFPAFFRIDRIISFKMLKEKYGFDLQTKYNVGEMIKSLKFMSGGKFTTVKLRLKNSQLNIVLDQLPNASIIEANHIDTYLKVKVFEDGFIKWVLNNTDNVEILEPLDLRSKIKNEALKIVEIYSNKSCKNYG